jgi:hypothetical protein
MFVEQMTVKMPNNSTYYLSFNVNSTSILTLVYQVSLITPSTPYNPYQPTTPTVPTEAGTLQLQKIVVAIQEEVVRIQTVIMCLAFVMISLISSYVVKKRTMVTHVNNPVNVAVLTITMLSTVIYIWWQYNEIAKVSGQVIQGALVITDPGQMYLFMAKMVVSLLIMLMFVSVYLVTWTMVKLDNIYVLLTCTPDTKEDEVIMVSIYPYYLKTGEKKQGIAIMDRDAFRRLLGHHTELKKMTRAVVDDDGNVGEVEMDIPLDLGRKIYIDGQEFREILADDIEFTTGDGIQTLSDKEPSESTVIPTEEDRKPSIFRKKERILSCRLLFAGIYSNQEYYYNLSVFKQQRDAITALEAARYPLQSATDNLANAKATRWLESMFNIRAEDDLSRATKDEVEEIAHLIESAGPLLASEYQVVSGPPPGATREPVVPAGASEGTQSGGPGPASKPSPPPGQ